MFCVVLINKIILYLAGPESERNPLLRSYVQGLPSMYTESVGNFYSPLNSPEGSLYRVETCRTCPSYPPARFTREQVSILINNITVIYSDG